MASRTNVTDTTSRGRVAVALSIALVISVACNAWAWQRLRTNSAHLAKAAPVAEQPIPDKAVFAPQSSEPTPRKEAPAAAKAAPPEKPKSSMADVVAAIENATNRRKLTSLKFSETSLVYGDFFRAQRFDRETLRRLRQKLAERAVFTTAVYAYGADLEQSDRDAISANYAAQFDNEIAAIIGADEAAKLKHYERTQGPRSIANRWSERVSYLAEPLTIEQRATLTELLVSMPPPGYPTSAEAAAGFEERQRKFHADLLKQATFLSPPQQSALADAMAEDNDWETADN